MKKLILPLLLVVCLLLPSGVFAVKAVTTSDVKSYKAGGVSITLSDPAGSIYQPGEAIQFSYETGEDAYVIVYNIDSEGYVHLISPMDGRLPERSSAGRRYVIPDPREAASLIVEGETGIEFVFALSIPGREYVDENELYFLADDRPFQIDGDPFLAANMIAGELIRGISQRDDVSLAYTYFHINSYVGYPRYICAECHEKSTQPYTEACTEYEFAPVFSGEAGNLTYPLGRAYDISPIEYADDDVYEDGEDVTRVEVVFYPYESYVDYYRPWWISSIYYDPWWYNDPFWHDPWYACAGYYPFHPWHNYRHGFWFSVGWNWGGYWPGYAYYPYYGFYHHGRPYNWFRPHRPGGYRYKGPSLTNTLQVASRRDPDLRISSIRHNGGVFKNGAYGNDATLRMKDGSVRSRLNPTSTIKNGKTLIKAKTPPVKRDRSHIKQGRDTGMKDGFFKKPSTKPTDRRDPKPKVRSNPLKPPSREIDRSKTPSDGPSKSKKPRSYVPSSRRTPEKKSEPVKPPSKSGKSSQSSMKHSTPAKSSPPKSPSSSSFKPPSHSSSPKSSPSRSGSSGGGKSRGGSSKGGKGKK